MQWSNHDANGTYDGILYTVLEDLVRNAMMQTRLRQNHSSYYYNIDVDEMCVGKHFFAGIYAFLLYKVVQV